ncbi:L,D-transpeptidase [Yinghuangia soli]|uniref:Ig-like domain-containing protein n=1 Tax=Yinghuangia soli TaxID=2908204 RepID=A0AA41U2M6_9ACTN|nr:Ig-like domain-containing protein [Yinghuangia soli]MCF2530850.1 Ig-like domain-containing protein [Yinghuangia soli]
MSRAAISGPRKGLRIALVPALAATTLLLAACGGGSSDKDDGQSAGNAGSGGAAATADQNNGKDKGKDPAPQVAVDPADKAADVEPGKPVTVTATEGTLTDVRISDADGGTVAGKLAADGKTWTSTGRTAPGTAYTVDIGSRTAKGKDQTSSTTFTTKKADKTNKVAMKPGNGGTFGIAQPVSITFDHPVADKAAVEKNLKVTTSVPTEGSWGWIKDSSGKDRVDWRPKDYWQPGTKVTLNADLKGVQSGTGTYFARDYETSFTVGTGRVVEVDVAKHKVNVVEGGQVVKSIPMSAGSDEFPTRGGTHVILAKNAKETLDSQTVGLGDKYNLPDVPWVVHFTSSGTFFHSAAWNTANIGKNNTSHGCVGMTVEDAKWFYDRVQVGDPVVVKGSKSTAVTEAGNGFGAWQVSYDQWKAKSALGQ